jgi:hypothetical protein
VGYHNWQHKWADVNGGNTGTAIVLAPLVHSLLEENKKLLVEIKDELLDMKKWLIATYPDIYKQYVCVKQLEEASK